MYRTIYRDLLRKIRSGEFRCGDRLPTEKQLCEAFAVSRITVRHAMEMLVRDGVVTRIKGKGTFVAPGPVGREVPGPNAPARRQIGLVVPNFSDAFGAKMLKSIEHACAQKGYDLVLRISWGDLENECAIIDDLRDCGLAGLIVQPVNGPRYNASLLRLILSESPVVVLDRRMPGVEACFVGTDNEASTRRIVQPLFDLGHENIAFVSPPPLQTSTLEERLHAFRACFYERNRVPDESYFFTNVRATLPSQDREEILREDLQNLAQHLHAHPEITAVFPRSITLPGSSGALRRPWACACPRTCPSSASTCRRALHKGMNSPTCSRTRRAWARRPSICSCSASQTGRSSTPPSCCRPLSFQAGAQPRPKPRHGPPDV